MTDYDIVPTRPPETDGLIFACRLNGEGGATLIGWDEVEAWTDGDGPLWIHLDHSSARARDWLSDRSGLTSPTVGAMLADETRPRVFRGKRGMAVFMRGVNLNSGSEPADMVAIRMWSEGQRVITLRKERMMSPQIVLASLTSLAQGPKTISELFERLISVVNEQIAPTVATFDDRLDNLESNLDLSLANEQRRELSNIRQEAVLMRRYIAPQREALNSLMTEPPSWLDDASRPHLRETTDRLMRYVEELDAARERSMVIKDDIANQLAESANKTLYMLAVISGVFLPLAFLTGLLGINIGGMPGVENDNAFWLFCGMIVALLVVEIALFRRMRWL